MISKKEAAIAILAAIGISAILFGTQYLLGPPPVPRHIISQETIIVKETEDISFQREGDWVLATFLDGTICIHDKREAEPHCQKSVKGPEL